MPENAAVQLRKCHEMHHCSLEPAIKYTSAAPGGFKAPWNAYPAPPTHKQVGSMHVLNAVLAVIVLHVLAVVVPVVVVVNEVVVVVVVAIAGESATLAAMLPPIMVAVLVRRR